MRPRTAQLTFPVMGSHAHLLVVTTAGSARVAERRARWLVGRARRRLEDLDRRWSRFRADSEVRYLADRAGEDVPVSADTLLLVRRAVEAWAVTGGVFDATVSLAALGYDRPLLQQGGDAPAAVAVPAPGAGRITVDPSTGVVRLPAGTSLDPGGLGKGLAADLVADELVGCGASGAAVNVGGDVRVTGIGPEGCPWRVGVPVGRGERVLELADGAVATSSPARRRWRTADGVRHHLVDPSTGESARCELASVTVVAPRCWQAEVAATGGAVGGWRLAERLAARLGGQALAVTAEDDALATGGLAGALT